MTEGAILFLIAMAAVIPFCVSMAITLRAKFRIWRLIFLVLLLLFVICSYATSGTIGIDPLRAYAWAMFFGLPAVLGFSAGGLLGWLIYRRKS